MFTLSWGAVSDRYITLQWMDIRFQMVLKTGIHNIAAALLAARLRLLTASATNQSLC